MRLPIAASTSAAMQLSIDLLNTLNGHGDLGGPLNVIITHYFPDGFLSLTYIYSASFLLLDACDAMISGTIQQNWHCKMSTYTNLVLASGR